VERPLPPKGTLVHRGPPVRRAHREFKEYQVRKVNLALRVRRDRKALPAKRERRVTREIKGKKAIRVILERVTKAIGVKKATKAPQEARSARYKLTVKQSVNLMRRWCRCSAQAAVRLTERNAPRLPLSAFVSQDRGYHYVTRIQLHNTVDRFGCSAASSSGVSGRRWEILL
jgi:hypothetical protein